VIVRQLLDPISNTSSLSIGKVKTQGFELELGNTRLMAGRSTVPLVMQTAKSKTIWSLAKH
jgi:hypothetical protein